MPPARPMAGVRPWPRSVGAGAFAALLALSLSLLATPSRGATTTIASLQQPVMDALKAALPPTTVCPSIWNYQCGGRKLCDASSYVVSLKMDGCGFSGAFPSAISGLSSLSSLIGSFNAFTSLPSTITALTKLTSFQFGENQLAGSFPSFVTSLPKIGDVWLGGNKLSGSLPASYAGTIVSLNVSNNLLSGSLPAGISVLNSLSSLSLQNNQFSGSLPSGWSRTPVMNMRLSNNQLTSLGSLASFSKLQIFYANNNSLTAAPDVGASLIALYLQNNQMQGSIPASFSRLAAVAYIRLDNNQLRGTVPNFLTSLGSLIELNLAGNYLSGNIPASFCNDDNSPFTYTFSGNCMSFTADYSCPASAVQLQKNATTCQLFCGDSCVPTQPAVDLTSAPLGGCLACASQSIAYQLGSSGVSYLSTAPPSSKGAPSRNIQRYLTVGPPSSSQGSIVGTSSATTWQSCCTDCAAKSGCSFWHFYPPANGPVPAIQGGQSGVFCYLLSISPPLAQLPLLQTLDSQFPVSHVGGKCNPAAQMVDDPHLVGAHGTPFDFPGELGHSFCLLSDARLHINVKLGGFLDSRLEQASKVVNGKAVRSWIKEVAILWKSSSGRVTTIAFKARPGRVGSEEGHRYLQAVSTNGSPAQLPEIGKQVTLAKDAVLSFKGIQQRARAEVAVYELYLKKDVVLGIRLRPAHRKLQTARDSQVHINVHLLKIETTPKVHGILGQTFREEKDRVRRAQLFTDISKLIRAPVAVDSSGRGFLDGQPEDYETSGLSTPDCMFAHDSWTKGKSTD